MKRLLVVFCLCALTCIAAQAQHLRVFVSVSNPQIPLPTLSPTSLGSVALPAGELNGVGQTFDVWADISQPTGYVVGSATLQLALCDKADCSGKVAQLSSAGVTIPNFGCLTPNCGDLGVMEVRGSFVVTQQGQSGELVGSETTQSNATIQLYGYPLAFVAQQSHPPIDLTRSLYLAVLMQANAGYQIGDTPTYQMLVCRVSLLP